MSTRSAYALSKSLKNMWFSSRLENRCLASAIITTAFIGRFLVMPCPQFGIHLPVLTPAPFAVRQYRYMPGLNIDLFLPMSKITKCSVIIINTVIARFSEQTVKSLNRFYVFHAPTLRLMPEPLGYPALSLLEHTLNKCLCQLG